MGDNPGPGVHSGGGFHYKCRNSGALDVNADNGPGSEGRSIDGIVGDVQKLGFRTIWQAPGHFDHIHIDVAPLGRDRCRRRDRRRGRRARGGRARGQADRLGAPPTRRSAASVASVRAASTAARPTRPWRGRSAARSTRQRLTEDPAGDVRDRDRRVRRPQPQLRRSRLDRRLPAAAIAGLGHRLLDHGPRRRGGRVHPPGEDQQRAIPATAPASSRSRSRSRASRCATTRSRSRRWRCWRSTAHEAAP